MRDEQLRLRRPDGFDGRREIALSAAARVGAGALSALSLTLIFPGFELHALAWLALVPLLLLTRSSTPGVAFLVSLGVGPRTS